METALPLPMVPYNVRVQIFDDRGVCNGYAYARAKESNTFAHVLKRVFENRQWGDHELYDWSSGTETLYGHGNGRALRMWEIGLPPPGFALHVVGKPRQQSCF